MAAPARVALVTGASRGIGRETALTLARHGFALFLAAEGTAALQAGAFRSGPCRVNGPGDDAAGQRPNHAVTATTGS